MWNTNVACIRILSLYLPEVTREHLSQESQPLGQVSSRGITRYQREMIATRHLLINKKKTSGTVELITV
jgi:hypothetical protein